MRERKELEREQETKVAIARQLEEDRRREVEEVTEDTSDNRVLTSRETHHRGVEEDAEETELRELLATPEGSKEDSILSARDHLYHDEASYKDDFEA